MAAIRSSETLVTTCKTKWRQNPEDHNPYFRRRENLKFHKIKFVRQRLAQSVTPISQKYVR
jgi:hypothetical protein